MIPTDWLDLLKEAVAKTSQTEVAQRLNVSQSTVSQALKGRYPASTANLEARVRGVYLHETVECPVLWEITRKKCQDTQRRPFAATNPQRAQVYWECRGGCPHSSLPNTRYSEDEVPR